MFDHAEALDADNDAALDVAALPPDTKAGTQPVRGKRRPLPAELKRVHIVRDVPAVERT